MSWHGRYSDWAPRVPVATRIARGHAAAKKLAAKEGRTPFPVTIEGRKIAKTFWGLKWCECLERHGDIANRLPRGATYVRNGSVADLVIEPGKVRAIVGGSEAYTVKIVIQTLNPAAWQAISRDCAQEIESLFDLLQGRFSDGVMKRLTQADGGLFPRRNEISMSCTCPDYAGVCKHIAAVFYGIAARLDRQPELLFKLRSVDHLELIGHATSSANLEQALDGSATATLSAGDLGEIFGIDLEPAEPASSSRVKSPVVPRVSTKRPAGAAKAKAPAASGVAQRGKKAEPVAPAPAKAPARSPARSKSDHVPIQALDNGSAERSRLKSNRKRKPPTPAPKTSKPNGKKPQTTPPEA